MSKTVILDTVNTLLLYNCHLVMSWKKLAILVNTTTQCALSVCFAFCVKKLNLWNPLVQATLPSSIDLFKSFKQIKRPMKSFSSMIWKRFWFDSINNKKPYLFMLDIGAVDVVDWQNFIPALETDPLSFTTFFHLKKNKVSFCKLIL